MRRAKGSPCDREPFGGFLGRSTTAGGGEEGEEGSEGSDMVDESNEDESGGRIANREPKEWRE